MTTTTQTSVSTFYLEKPPKSLFVDIECREFPNFELVYGFIQNKMGVKLRKSQAVKYEDEQTHYKHYIKKTKWVDDSQFISVQYSHSSHTWGRINALGSLSLSLFHRPTRHSYSKDLYIDCDIVNCQIQIIMEKAILKGLNILGLKEYCENPKKCRYEIAKWYKLKDIKSPDGVVLTAYEQAKKLPIRLAFGGGIYKWKQQYGALGIKDMPLVIQLESTIKTICEEVCDCNPQIIEDAEKNPDFEMKSDDEKKRSVMALFAQTWERIIQEECIAHTVRSYKSVQLRDVVPSQDGFMLLKSQAVGIDFKELFSTFTNIVKSKFDMTICWSVKDFDEAIEIPSSKNIPIDIYLSDLEKGERHIADLIAPLFRNQMKYYQDDKIKRWYYLNNKNLWISSNDANEYLITKTIQDLIEEEKMKTWSRFKAEKDEEKKKKLGKEEESLKKQYEKVGKMGYSKQVAKFLATLLLDRSFPDKLDLTAGSLVFNDGILNLRSGDFKKGFVAGDYITVADKPLLDYLSIKCDAKKREFVLSNLKKILNNNDEQLDYYLSVIGHSMTGDAHLEKAFYYIIDGTENCKGNNGKTFLFTLLSKIFPHLVQITDPKVLERDYAKAHKHISKWRGKRIIYADEGTKKRTNDSLVKKIGDGLEIENEIMFGYVEIIKIYFKMFVCSNHLPKFEDDNEAVFNRFKQIQMCSHFDTNRTEDDVEKLEFIGDSSLCDTLAADYVNEIVDIVIGYAVRYYKQGIPAIPQVFKTAAAKTKLVNNEFATWFFKEYEAFPDTKVSNEEIMRNPFKTYGVEEMRKNIGILGYKYDKELFIRRIPHPDNPEKEKKIKGGFMGFRKIVEEEEEEV